MASVRSSLIADLATRACLLCAKSGRHSHKTYNLRFNRSATLVIENKMQILCRTLSNRLASYVN